MVSLNEYENQQCQKIPKNPETTVPQQILNITSFVCSSLQSKIHLWPEDLENIVQFESKVIVTEMTKWTIPQGTDLSHSKKGVSLPC